MAKYKAKNKNAKLVVRVKLLRGEVLSERDLSMASQRSCRGLLKPEIIKQNQIEYTGPQGICLADYLKQALSGYDFHYIMAQIVRLERKLTASGLAIKHLVADLHYVYINPYTKELQFIYLPLSSSYLCVMFLDFMEAIACAWKPALEEDMQYVSRFLSLIRGQQGYQPDKILAYIKQYDRRVAEQLRKSQTSVSGFITNKQADYYSHYGNNGGHSSGISHDADGTALIEDAGAMSSSAGIEETGLLSAGFQDDTALLGGTNSPRPGAKQFPQWDEETGLLNESPLPQWNEETGMLDEATLPQWDEETGLLHTPSLPQWEEETGLLAEPGETELFSGGGDASPVDEETGLLVDNSPSTPARYGADNYPYLIRKTMNEKIIINKPVFRIGKERSYVDYFISNNGAISRSHADIIKRGNRYFICDRNSTNKTYRNGYMLTPENEVEIFDGDMLQLANEEFEFHTT